VEPNPDAQALSGEAGELARIPGTWKNREKAGKVLRLWVKGLPVDWAQIYEGTARPKPRRISLPTYPFARQRYWLPELEPGESDPAARSTSMTGTALYRERAKPSAISLAPLSPGPGPSLLPDQAVVQTPPPVTLAPVASPPQAPVQTNGSEKIPPAIPAAVPSSPESLEQALRLSLAEILHQEPSKVRSDTPFVRIGLDSISGVQWIRVINKQFGESIPVIRLYDYPTLSEFAEFLGNRLKLPGDSLDDLLRQVQQGTLDVENAGVQLQRFLGQQ
jgi:polyketide synthase PksL